MFFLNDANNKKTPTPVIEFSARTERPNYVFHFCHLGISPPQFTQVAQFGTVPTKLDNEPNEQIISFLHSKVEKVCKPKGESNANFVKVIIIYYYQSERDSAEEPIV